MLGKLRQFLNPNRPLDVHIETCMALFQETQTELAAHFLNLASATGKPRGLRWKQLTFVEGWKLIRDVPSNEAPSLATASNESADVTDCVTLVHSVNISFEAIEGSDMEDVAAVSTIRDGCAIFHYRAGGRWTAGRWGTAGRVLLNLTPAQAVQAAFPDAKVIGESNPA